MDTMAAKDGVAGNLGCPAIRLDRVWRSDYRTRNNTILTTMDTMGTMATKEIEFVKGTSNVEPGTSFASHGEEPD